MAAGGETSPVSSNATQSTRFGCGRFFTGASDAMRKRRSSLSSPAVKNCPSALNAADAAPFGCGKVWIARPNSGGTGCPG